LLGIVIGVVPWTATFALNPSVSIAQFKHTRWTIDDDVPFPIYSLAQGRDGYLWIGSRGGLYRFDGIRFEKIEPEHPIAARTAVSRILAARDGAIWVGYRSGGVAVYRDGVLRDTGLVSDYVTSLAETGDGVIWASFARLDNQLARYAHGRWDRSPSREIAQQHEISNMIGASNGALWVAQDGPIFVLRKGAAHFEQHLDLKRIGGALSEDPAGRIWLSDAAGSAAIFPQPKKPGSVYPYPTPGFPRDALSLMDRDGNLWGKSGTDGIFRVRSPRPDGALSAAAAASAIERFEARDGLGSKTVLSMIEDREHNIWVGTASGLERFRPANVIAESSLADISLWGNPMRATSDGSVFVGQHGGVFRIPPNGRPELFLAHDSETEAICEGADRTIWIALSDRLVSVRSGRATSIGLPAPNERGNRIGACAVDREKILWLSTEKALFRQTSTGWRRYKLPAGLTGGAIIALRDGQLVGNFSPDRFAAIAGGPIRFLRAANSKAISGLTATLVRRNDLLVGGMFGLTRIVGRHYDFLSAERFPQLANVSGISESSDGETWLMTAQGILRLSTRMLDRAFADPRAPLPMTILGPQDGLPGVGVRFDHDGAVRGGDGRLWFSTTGGVVWVDPANFWRNRTAPPVAISALKIAGHVYHDPAKLVLPAGTVEGEIDYAALSLAISKRVQVLYRLEGMDSHWVDPGLRRQMFFSNLGPGTYRFRVLAANDDGVWNRAGATLEFTIPPTFVQSVWFKLLCAAAIGTALWLLYVMRLRQMTARLQAGLEVRLAERERIARELHDTLLQGFQGLILRFHALADRIPFEDPWRDMMRRELDNADAVLIEGRDLVGEVRVAAESGDLARSLMGVAAELDRDHSIGFEVTVEGGARAFHPIVTQEVRRIGEEAIRNAFHHSRGSLVTVGIEYHRRRFRMRISDNGIGLPPEIVSVGMRPGHFGLQGMRERAQHIGGDVTIISRPGIGTDIQFSISGRTAYAAPEGPWLWPFFRRRRNVAE
jgi:signal transduction histidine kinase/ligand-binding sensor domain-containing protein